MSAPPTGLPAPYGKYRLLKKLARGGMAELFLASDPNGQLVVIKRVLSHLTTEEEFLRMFLDEARIASQLNHPSIVKIFDLGLEQDHLYIAMEHIDGIDLERICKVTDVIPCEIAARVAAQVCSALYYANRMTDLNGRPLNVVHRDVTPGNIMLTRHGGVKLVDFGIAKATAQLQKTRPGVVKGKFRYMSPEQVRQSDVDGRSDLFSLGTVLYEVTTGKKPFEREAIIEIIRALISYVPPAPIAVVPSFPKRLSNVIIRALEKEPSKRFKNARDMQTALEEALKSMPSCGANELAAYVKQFLKPSAELDKLPAGLDPVTNPEREIEKLLSEASRRPKSQPPRSPSFVKPPPLPVRAEEVLATSEITLVPVDDEEPSETRLLSREEFVMSEQEYSTAERELPPLEQRRLLPFEEAPTASRSSSPGRRRLGES